MSDVIYLAWRYLAYHKLKTGVLIASMTTIVYLLEFRGLRVAEGRSLAMMGECVLGAKAARTANAGPGDYIMSSPEGVFDIAGVYLLKMKVVGVLGPSATPDDLAVFVDLKTTWVIEGLAHGHRDLSRLEAANGVLRREGSRIIANASVMEYNELTVDNRSSFHFHGDPASFPITSVYVVNYPLKYFAERIGGERVSVVFPAPPDEDPAFWMPDAETIAAFQRADLVLLNGAGYAKWVDKVSLPRSRLCDTSASFADEYIELHDPVTHTHGPAGQHAHGGTARSPPDDLGKRADGAKRGEVAEVGRAEPSV